MLIIKPIICRCSKTALVNLIRCYATEKPHIFDQPWRKEIIKPTFGKHTKWILPTGRLYRLDFSLKNILRILKKVIKRSTKADQRFNTSREAVLGRDLSCAHFVLARGGAVKFVNQDDFVRKKKGESYQNLVPGTKDVTYKVESIDFGNMQLYYEGLENIKDLKYLKSINFSGNLIFDDWHIDYLATLVPNLEYLDISGCKKVTYRGILSLYRLRHLKGLNIENISDSDDFKLACLSLEDESKNLILRGILPDMECKLIQQTA